MIQKSKQICDIYLTSPVRGDHGCLQGLNLLRPLKFIDGQKTYSGYLGVDLRRLHAVSAVVCLRHSHFASFNVPIEYRDNENIPHDKARSIAEEFLKYSDERLAHNVATGLYSPVFWAFPFKKNFIDPNAEEIVGSKHIHVDRIDGRVWSYDEVCEYNYDYNNLL